MSEKKKYHDEKQLLLACQEFITQKHAVWRKGYLQKILIEKERKI